MNYLFIEKEKKNKENEDIHKKNYLKKEFLAK